MIKDRAFGRQDSTAAAREANKMFRKVEAAPSEHVKADKAFQANRERLKAERLARESQHPANKTRSMTSLHREARQAIVREWDHWIKTQPLDGKACARDARRFFLEIKARREPTLLDFWSGAEDKWQIVYQWLMAEQRISS